ALDLCGDLDPGCLARHSSVARAHGRGVARRRADRARRHALRFRLRAADAGCAARRAGAGAHRAAATDVVDTAVGILDRRRAAHRAGSVPAGHRRGGPRYTRGTDRLMTLRSLSRTLTAYGQLMRLDRPIGTWLLLWPVLWALWIAGEGH